MIKKYIDLANKEILHYMPAEYISGQMDNVIEIMLNEYDDFDLPEDFVTLGRFRDATIAKKIRLDSDLQIMDYMGVIFSYPEGTTHFLTKLYMEELEQDYYSSQKIPVALKIDDGKISVFKHDGWEQLESGNLTNAIDYTNIHSIEFLSSYVPVDLPPQKFIIEEVISNMDQSINDTFLLKLYNISLSNLFEEKYSNEKLIELFKNNKVFVVSDEDGDNKYTYLNQMLFNVVSGDEFKKAYKKVLDENNE